MTIQQAKRMIDDSYVYYGVRCHHGTPVAVGETVENSFVWIDGEKTSEMLDGTCAINLKRKDVESLIDAYRYLGDMIVIAGDYMQYGDDDGEIVIQNAVRIA